MELTKILSDHNGIVRVSLECWVCENVEQTLLKKKNDTVLEASKLHHCSKCGMNEHECEESEEE